MTIPEMPAGTEFRMGPIFGRAWSVYAANFLKFTLVGIIISLPNLFSGDYQSVEGGARTGLAAIVGLVFYFVGQAVILYGAFQALLGRPVSLGEATRRGLARFWAIIGITLLFLLAIIVGIVIVSFGAWLAAPIGVLLAIVFIVLLAMLMIRWSVAVPACVVENLGPLMSVRRSADLTKGHRWQIVGIFVAIFIVILLASLIVLAIVVPIAAVTGGGAGGGLIGGLLSLIVTAIYTAYLTIIDVMIYHDLRVAKEGIDTNQIASVFD